MKQYLTFVLIVLLAGCSSSTSEKAQSATDSYRDMLRCKHNLSRIHSQAALRPKRRNEDQKRHRYRKSIEDIAGKCPVAQTDTYSAGYDPKTGTTYCQGEHHAKAGLAPDYPRIVPAEELPNLREAPRGMERDYFPQIVENSLYTSQLPPGFPYPIPEGEKIETLSSIISKDGVWHAHLYYPGDIEKLWDTWLEVSLRQANLTKDQVGGDTLKPDRAGRLGTGGKTPLADEVGARLDPKEHFIVIQYQPKFLVNDSGQ